MEFTVKKSTLQKELGFVQGVIEKKNTIPVLQNILIKSKGEGIEIVATDLDVSIRCQCEAEIKQSGTMLVHARKLFDIVRSLPEADIHLKKDDQSWAVLQCERSRFRIVGQPEENFPAVPEVKTAKVSLSSEVLRYFIEHTIFAITQEESQRYALSGAQFLLSKGVGRMIATDGHRLAFVEHKSLAEGLKEEIKMLIPKKTLAELLKIAGEAENAPVMFERDDNHLFFQLGGRVLISRTLSGQFPNYELVMPKETNHTMTFESERIAAAIRRVALMADEKSHGIKLKIQDGKAEFTSQNSEVGEAREILPVEYGGPEINVGFNSQYLLDFLLSVNSSEIYFEFKDVQSQAQLRPKTETEYDYRYVVMPMRI
ncbi:MAG: DNA polymerase III subunit beta [Acidobacteriota bacterium]